jgi:hypothetical protein
MATLPLFSSDRSGGQRRFQGVAEIGGEDFDAGVGKLERESGFLQPPFDLRPADSGSDVLVGVRPCFSGDLPLPLCKVFLILGVEPRR